MTALNSEPWVPHGNEVVSSEPIAKDMFLRLLGICHEKDKLIKELRGGFNISESEFANFMAHHQLMDECAKKDKAAKEREGELLASLRKSEGERLRLSDEKQISSCAN